MAHSLTIEAAFRYGDYSTVGGVSNWKAGLNWAPIESLTFHAVYANANRAPNIGELFAGQSQTFPSGLTDPCEGVGATTAPAGVPSAVASYCRSLPGFAQNIAIAGNGGVFTYNDNSDRQSIEGFDGGNADLGEETAKTWTVGFDFVPAAVPGLSFTVDYFDIRVQDAIQLVPRQFIIDTCVNSLGTDTLCSFITRENANPLRPRSPATVWQVNSGPVNAGGIVASGVDLGTRYGFGFGNGHRLNVALNYTYLDKLTLQPLKDGEIENNKGQLDGDGRLGAGFEHRANLNFGYDAGRLKASWRVNYQSSIVDTLGGGLLTDEDNSVPAYTYHDVQARYSFGADDMITAYIGVDNLFDKKPPPINQNGASNITGTETAADSYDPFGRFAYLGFELKF